MNSLSSLLHVWKIALFTLIVGIVAVGTVAWWIGWKWAIALAIYILWVNVEWWIDLKKRLLANLPEELRYESVQLDELPPDWDRIALEEDTKTLVELGFHHLRDIRLADSWSGGNITFSRLLTHPQDYCFAELIYVAVPNQKPLPNMCSIHSKLDQGWAFSSFRTKISGLSYMWRNPQELWSYHPNTTIPELFSAHLQRRQELIQRVNATVLQELSWEIYEYQTRESAVKRRHIFQRKNIVWALWEATWCELAQPTEWMGALAK